MAMTEVGLPVQQAKTDGVLDGMSDAGPVATSRVDDADLIAVVHSLPVGDSKREAACEELVARYGALVHSCAQHYAPDRDMAEDLVQVGYVGLLSAINNFNPEFGRSLLAYARPCILGEIKRYFRDKRWPVRAFRSAQEGRAAVLRAEAELTQQLMRAPRDEEVGQHLRLEVADVREARLADRAFQTLSLDAPFSGDPDAGTLSDVMGADDLDLETVIDMNAVWEHLGELPDREQLLLNLRFYGNMTQSQIAERLGVSQMHVSRLLGRALGYLRNCVVGPE
jgi:RNA polymerase sigma-B factor